MELAPYQRIANDIREQIADGRLAPGDRVPSTRRLARNWDVALATATKAMTVLCREGVLQARPRSGTVVTPVSGTGTTTPTAPGAVTRAGRASRSAERELTRERVVRVATEIADAEGLDALSMRGVAARLGVATMSTYRHVASKDELVVFMADAAFGELDYPGPLPDGWRPLLERASRTLWALFRRHPWLAQVTPLTRPLPLRNLLRHGEQMYLALDGFDLDATMRLDLQVMLYSHIQGLAVQLEREAQAQATTGLSEDQWMDLHGPALGALAASGRYPGFAALMTAFDGRGYDLDLDKIFELGLQTLLDGLAILLSRRAQLSEAD
ncbi:GntR family transcriptional regulator [Actinoplanes sp. NPDC026623]|uniref:GntR family transcriptional regulator n=1 Tax=Actinoplanes sp. NPDC026623 TaxID=3155610 RepID=UPI0033C19643